jgi:hypothetical protein
MDEWDQQAEPLGFFWSLMMMAYAVGFWFFLMISIPLTSIWDMIQLGLNRYRDSG